MPSRPEAKKPRWPRWRTVGVVLVLVIGCWLWRDQTQDDYVITNVQYLRGDEISDETVNIGIKRGRIAWIGKEPFRARSVISGEGLILTPGLIDVNTCGWLSESAAVLKLKDGVTTFFNAHGDSFKANAERFGASRRLNYATSVGLVPAIAKHLTGPDMMQVLDESLRYGAYTISLSPEYTAETTPELVTELGRHFAGKNVLFSFHLRHSSQNEELAGVREAIDCALLGNPVHVLHFPSTGATWDPTQAVQMVEAANRSGARITFDFYPYTAWASSIHRARFTGDWRARYQVDFSKVHILGEPPLTEERFRALRSDSLDRTVIVDSIPQATVDFFALHTSCPIGTDSEAKADTTHPRGAGSFTKFINDYVDTGRLDFAKTMHRFSTATVRVFAPYIPDLENLGEIKVGAAADLVLWKRPDIKSLATFENPHAASSGVVAAFVNGVPQILNGEAVNVNITAGRHLKGSWAK